MSIRASLFAAVLALAPIAHAGNAPFFGYGQSYRSFTPPPVGPGSFGVTGDALADGRLAIVTGLSVFVETAPSSGAFNLAATIDSELVGGATDPSFLKVSPDGSTIALGAGFARPLVTFSSTLLSGGATIDASNAQAFDVPYYSAAWRDGSTLGLTFGTMGQPSSVALLDVTGSPSSPGMTTILSGILGGSGGIAFDSAGRLFTGNGFDTAPGDSATGWIKAFEPSSWWSGPADFESDGAFIADVLSADALNFDTAGNLFVGGGDFASGDSGTLAVLHSGAIAAALAGGTINLSDPAQVRRLDPRADGFGYFGSIFNGATGELIVTDFGGAWHATVPAPGALALFALPLGARRRRAL